MKDTILATFLGAVGVATWATDLEFWLKVLVAGLTSAVLGVKLFLLLIRNWDQIRHPLNYIQKRREIKANKPATTTL